MHETEKFEHAGCTVRIGLDDDPEHANPREMDNPSLLFCWHPDYVLGDEQFTSTGRGGSGLPQFEAMEDVPGFLREERGAVGPILPLYLYDHSGITMSAGAPNPLTFDAAGWDTTMVGFACAPRDRWDACMGTEPTDEEVERVLREEVKVYDAYLRGSVFFYTVEDEDGEDVDSCGGFLVVDAEDEEELRKEAKAAAEAHLAEQLADAEPDLEGAIREVTR